MGYRHGIYISELATSITPPVQVSAGLIVAFGTAPVNQLGKVRISGEILLG